MVTGNSAGSLKGKYKAKLEFLEAWGVQSKNPSMGEVWIFSRTTH